MQKLRLLILFLFTFILCSSFIMRNASIASNTSDIKIHYFYSPTCSSCQDTGMFLDIFLEKHSNVTIEKHNIAALKEKAIMDKYMEVYRVAKEDEGIVPVIFIGNKYLAGEQNIIEQLDRAVIEEAGNKTLEVESADDNHERDIDRFINYRVFGVLTAGLLNGINPCSLSMLLFFASILALKKFNIMKAGVSYSMGKLISFLLLGTLLFKMLEHINLAGYFVVMKGVMLVTFTVLAALNINDYFAAKNEHYNNVKAQLPMILRKANHKIIKKLSSISSKQFILIASFVLGFIITFGEFLCTGQIYLATIVTILQYDVSLNLLALSYLFLYGLGFIFPGLILSWIIFKGKEVFEVSETIRAKLPLIKLANAFIFLLFCLLLLFVY